MIRFPKKASNRKFVSAWYTKHKWLEYSVMEDKAYCHFCRIFSGNKDFIFEKSGFNDWTHACAGLDKHEKTAIHKSAEIAFNNRVMQDCCHNSINVELETFRKNTVKKTDSISEKLSKLLSGYLSRAWRLEVIM